MDELFERLIAYQVRHLDTNRELLEILKLAIKLRKKEKNTIEENAVSSPTPREVLQGGQ